MTSSLRKASAGCVLASLLLWTASAGEPEIKPKVVLDGKYDSVTRLAFSPDGKLLAAASTDTRITLFDLEKSQELRVLGTADKAARVGLSFSPDGKAVAALSKDGKDRVSLWPIAGAEKDAAVLEPPDAPSVVIKFDQAFKRRFDAVQHPLFSPDGKYVAVLDARHTNTKVAGALKIPVAFFIWETASRKPVVESSAHVGWIRAAHTIVPYELLGKLKVVAPQMVAVSADGGLAAVAVKVVAKVGVWDAGSAERMLWLPHTGASGEIVAAFNRDGSLLATGGAGIPIRVWQVPARKKSD